MAVTIATWDLDGGGEVALRAVDGTVRFEIRIPEIDLDGWRALDGEEVARLREALLRIEPRP